MKLLNAPLEADSLSLHPDIVGQLSALSNDGWVFLRIGTPPKKKMIKMDGL